MSDQAEPIGAEMRDRLYEMIDGFKDFIALDDDQRMKMRGRVRCYVAMIEATPAPDPKAAGVEREAIARAVLDGWYCGNVDWEAAPQHWKDSAYHAADAVAALRAVDAAPGGGVPAGMLLVPINPTAEMLEAAYSALEEYDITSEGACTVTEAHRAMLAAAPATPTAPAPNVQALVEAAIALADYADLMPKKTPAAGSCVTVHQFDIEAGTIWGLDTRVKVFRAAVAAIQAPAGEGVA